MGLHLEGLTVGALSTDALAGYKSLFTIRSSCLQSTLITVERSVNTKYIHSHTMIKQDNIEKQDGEQQVNSYEA